MQIFSEQTDRDTNYDSLYTPLELQQIYLAEPEIVDNVQTQTIPRPNTRGSTAENRRKYTTIWYEDLTLDEDVILNKRPRTADQQMASLYNIGNTCYLNSVVYTLRFAPGFLHNLHHLTKEQMDKHINGPRPNHLNAIEKLHELYACLSTAESSGMMGTYRADTFLSAMQEVSPVFDGNHQQDAHEFLMCILDSIRQACQWTNCSSNE